MKNIIENVTIFYKNGSKQICDAIEITKQGVYTGNIKTTTHGGEVFEDYGFIPHDQIKRVTIFDEYGNVKDIDLKNNNK